jgi:apolipoprotein N-acyltransferase
LSLARAVPAALLSGTAWALSMPGFGRPLLAWIALVPLLVALRRVGARAAFGSGLACGLAFALIHGWWTTAIGMHPVAAGLGMLAFAAYVGVFALAARLLRARAPEWDLATFPSLWILLEWARVHAGFLAFPFGMIGVSQYEVLRVAQIASVAGVYGVSFAIVAVNVTLAQALARFGLRERREGGRRLWVAALASAACLVALPWLSAPAPSAPGPGESAAIRVALVQAGVYSGASADPREVTRRYVSLSREVAAQEPDLIAWPASSVPYDISRDRAMSQVIAEFADTLGAPLLVGSAGQDKAAPGRGGIPHAANSAFLYKERGLAGRYDKIRLLPFNEYLPLRGRVHWPEWIVSSRSDAAAGSQRTVFEVAGARFAVLICWESLFADSFREATAGDVDFVVSMTNEGFTDAPRAHAQMLAQNVFRAIENRIGIARPATTGISALIAPDGRISAQIPGGDGHSPGSHGSRIGRLPLARASTLYARFGDWLAAGAAVVVLAATVAAVRRTKGLGIGLPSGLPPGRISCASTEAKETRAMRRSTLVVMLVVAGLVAMGSFISLAQVIDANECERSCYEQESICTSECATREDPIECEQRCQGALLDCAKRCR